MSKIDLHIHTAEVSNCGNISAKELIGLYHEKGYEGLVITDHYFKQYFDDLGDLPWEEKIHRYLEGYRIALLYGSQYSMTILLGMEIRFEADANDYLVYGIDEKFLIENPEIIELNVEAFIKLAKVNQLMVFQAHPFRRGMNRDYIALVDGFECYNGNQRHDSRNQLAEALNDELQLIGISGSDFHETEDLAVGGILTDYPVKTMDELIKVLKSKAFKIIKEGQVG